MLSQPLRAALNQLRATATRPVVLIDGGAGSGKSTLAAEVCRSWPGDPIQLLSMDELYPGWDGLAAASAALPQLLTGAPYRRWDWAADAPGAVHRLDPGRPLLVEGCGCLTPATRALAGLAVWLEVPPALRRQRALERDGELFAPHWEQWARQEAEHWRGHRPAELADLVISE